MAVQGESKLSREIIDAIEGNWEGAALIKVSPSRYMSKGCPDILGVVQGRMVAIEVKMPGKLGNVSADQEKWLTKFGDAGAISIAVTSVKDALIAIAAEMWGLPPPMIDEELELEDELETGAKSGKAARTSQQYGSQPEQEKRRDNRGSKPSEPILIS